MTDIICRIARFGESVTNFHPRFLQRCMYETDNCRIRLLASVSLTLRDTLLFTSANACSYETMLDVPEISSNLVFTVASSNSDAIVTADPKTRASISASR